MFNKGRVTMAHTSTDYNYYQFWQTTADMQHVVFSVRACNDAHIIMSTGLFIVHDVYEVALGIKSNTESVIRTATQVNEN